MAEISPSSIAIYLEHRPSRLEKTHRPPDTGIKDKSRGESRPPVPGSAIEWMDGAVWFTRTVRDRMGKRYEECGRHENMKYLSYVHSISEAYRDGIERHGKHRLGKAAGAVTREAGEERPGVPFSLVANELWHDPAAVATWRDGRTAEARAMARAFDALCHRVAVDFGHLHPDVSMFVELHPTEGRRAASELPQVAREDAGRTKRENTREELSRIGREIAEVKKEADMTVTSAIMVYMKRREKEGRSYVGIAKLWRAWSVAKDDGAAA